MLLTKMFVGPPRAMATRHVVPPPSTPASSCSGHHRMGENHCPTETHTHTHTHTHKEGQAIATPSQTSCTLELSSSCGPLNTKYAVPSTSPILACFGLFVFFQCVQSDFLFWESDTRSLFFVVFLLFLLFFFFFCFLLWLLLFLVLVDETNNLVDVVAGPLNVGTPLRNITPRTGKEHPSSNLVNGPLDGKWTRARE